MLSLIKKLLLDKNSLLYKLFFSPFIYVDGKKSSYHSCKRFKYAVYFDNSDPASILQIDKWFNNNFFHKDNTLIIFKINQSVLSKHTAFLKQKNYNFYAFRLMKHFDFMNIKYIFYIFNSPSNTILTKNHTIKHIWLAHGESDKLASVNPMIRIYDHIFVAGDISIQRLKNYNIVNQCDIETRVLKIGIPYFEKQTNTCIDDKFKILLAPTWEGIEKAQEYSSLENNFLQDILLNIQGEHEDCEIYFMPHPSTGIKDSKYIEYVKNIVINNKENKNFYIIQNKDSFILKHINNILDKKQYLYNIPEYCSYDLTITDISSIMAELIYNQANYIVLVKKDILAQYKNDMQLLRKMMPLLSLSSLLFNDELKEFKELSKNEILTNKENRYKMLLGYNDEKMERLDISKRLDYCIKLIS